MSREITQILLGSLSVVVSPWNPSTMLQDSPGEAAVGNNAFPSLSSAKQNNSLDQLPRSWSSDSLHRAPG